MMLLQKAVLMAALFVSVVSLPAQAPAGDTIHIFRPKLLSLIPADSFYRERFWLTAGTGGVFYSGLSIALWNAWYKDYPLTHFHTFNDWGEWLDMDKSGHLFSAYIACNYSFRGARWTGMNRRKAMWTAVGIGTGLQATIEVMDGFSEKWGFSLGDIAFNTLGAGLFAAQELGWQEQRIQMKASGIRPDYSQEAILSSDGGQVTNLDDRAAGLYGTSFFHVILKDYNALTVWASANVHAFLPNKKNGRFPTWLNLAFGYGANNLYGGFENTWTDDSGATYVLDPAAYPRYRQFYLSPDIDWTRIPTRHRWLKFVLGLFNWVKFPAPAFEVNTLGKLKFHTLYW
jgi:hypothetical protein